MKRILLVEDDEKLRASLAMQLREAQFRVEALGQAEDALPRLRGPVAKRPELLLLDVRLPGMSGVELVRELAHHDLLPSTLVLSGEASIGEAVEALRLGVHDFLEKPFGKERLLQAIRNTFEHAELKRQVATLRSELAGQPALLGESEAIRELEKRIAKAAPTEARVLIRGESGTGKELVANGLHHGSQRRDRPFVKMNCAAVPTQLIEDELFGHVRGAFTDAKAPRTGLFEEAHGGTLFLDEIGDMDVQLQARLLRVLEDGMVRRIGDRNERKVDVRVIAATHRNLEVAVESGDFREDLYFRLSHLVLDVPPLRERRGDLHLLFRHFVDLFCERHRLRLRRIDEAIFEPLEAYGWPGNVRELRNLCERLVVFAGDILTPNDLPSSILDPKRLQETGLLRLGRIEPPPSLRDFRAQCEKEYIENTLRRSGWNFTAAAKLLGIQRTYLHQKAKELGIHRSE